jgi:hypothetical protein
MTKMRSGRDPFKPALLTVLCGLATMLTTWNVAAQLAGSPAAPPYDAARWHPIHFQPMIQEATDEQCLACHREVLDTRVRAETPAGVKTEDTLAWYQTLETYEGDQDTFHRRHLVTPLARELMDLRCNTCHQGNDPREEVSGSAADTQPRLVMRKHVDPNVCLMCHGAFNHQVMGLPGPWHEHADSFGNSCVTCHAAFRTHRHQVNFLRPEAIEQAGVGSSDTCYGCHGGRSWYRIAYPYPRHAWPGMPATVPDWAADRPAESQPRFRIESTNAPSAGTTAGSR